MKGRKLILGLAGATGIAMASSQAMALRVNIDDYELNFAAASAAEGGALKANLDEVDDWGLINSRSVVVVNDTNGNGVPDAGETFTDYFIVRADVFQDKNSTPITPIDYGAGAAGTHEITMKVELTGTQTVSFIPGVQGGSFSFDEVVPQWDIIYDNSGGGGFTPSNYGDLTTFTDGIIVEQITKLIAEDSSGTQNIVNDFTVVNGRIDVVGFLDDQLASLPGSGGEDFETDLRDFGGNPIGDSFENGMFDLLGVIDANFAAITEPLQAFAIINQFADEFGFEDIFVDDMDFLSGLDANLIVLAFESDGTFNKAAQDVIPEPMTGGLAALGLSALAGSVTRRRRA